MLVVEALNLLNEKGFRYKAEAQEGNMSLKFGLLQEGKKSVVSITPLADTIVIQGIGNEKQVDVEGLETFIDNVTQLKSLQEEESKLLEVLRA